MRLLILILFSTGALAQTCVKYELKPVKCDGATAGWTAPITGPKSIVSAMAVDHIGVPPPPYRQQFAGHFIMKITADDVMKTRSHLLMYPHDQGFQGMRFTPPRKLAKGDKVFASYTCHGAPTQSLNPTVELCWITPRTE